ncbi:macrolide transporter subunit MacA [compost metagenome]
MLFDVANTDGALRPQMSAQSYFVIARAEDAVTVPMAALQTAPRRPRAEKATSSMDAVAATPEAPAEKAAPRKGGRRNAAAPGSAPRPRAQLVRVVKADGTIEERRVMVGVTNRVQAQVLSGLEPGEMVVIGTQDGAALPAAAKKGSPRPAGKARL